MGKFAQNERRKKFVKQDGGDVGGVARKFPRGRGDCGKEGPIAQKRLEGGVSQEQKGGSYTDERTTGGEGTAEWS